VVVFLRKLEYYQGILILTTNMIDCIDEAFESRISYPVEFPELSQLDRHQIWTDFIKDMDLVSPHKRVLLDETDRWAAAEINGRQIRNILSMAESLALGDDRHARLTPDHVDKILDVTLEFSGSNKRNAARMKRDYFKY
jgi:SpoVK/Ycf46/Vps4 family AAA+-type ATPase